MFYPPAPLLNLVDPTGMTSDAALADALGVSDRTVARWRCGTSVSDRVADQVAVTIGLHPALIWPEWWSPTPAMT